MTNQSALRHFGKTSTIFQMQMIFGTFWRPCKVTVSTKGIAPHIPSNKGKGTWKQVSIPIGAVSHPSKVVHLPA